MESEGSTVLLFTLRTNIMEQFSPVNSRPTIHLNVYADLSAGQPVHTGVHIYNIIPSSNSHLLFLSNHSMNILSLKVNFSAKILKNAINVK